MERYKISVIRRHIANFRLWKLINKIDKLKYYECSKGCCRKVTGKVSYGYSAKSDLEWVREIVKLEGQIEKTNLK